MKVPLLLTLAAAALAALLISCRDAEEEVAPAPTAASASPGPTEAPTPTPSPNTNFKTLTNTVFGYSLQYPSSWLLNPEDPAADATTSSYVVIWSGPPPTQQFGKPDPNLVKLEIYAVPNPEKLTLDEWLAQRDKEAPTSIVVLGSEEISINNTPARRRLVRYLGEGTGNPVYTLHIPRDGFVLEIGGLPAADSPARPQVDQIISSMVFK
jgi:hypothetical protein